VATCESHGLRKFADHGAYASALGSTNWWFEHAASSECLVDPHNEDAAAMLRHAKVCGVELKPDRDKTSVIESSF
jgi:hypothetical protein